MLELLSKPNTTPPPSPGLFQRFAANLAASTCWLKHYNASKQLGNQPNRPQRSYGGGHDWSQPPAYTWCQKGVQKHYQVDRKAAIPCNMTSNQEQGFLIQEKKWKSAPLVPKSPFIGYQLSPLHEVNILDPECNFKYDENGDILTTQVVPNQNPSTSWHQHSNSN